MTDSGLADALPPTRADSPGPREPGIDALRGLCLLGIAVVNLPWIGSAWSLPLQLGLHAAGKVTLSPPDLAAAGLVEWLFEGKFYPQFAALFGFGAGVLMSRGMRPYLRRLRALLAFGVLHSIFGWWGDILLDYALVGAALALLSRAPLRVLFAVTLLTYAGATAASFAIDDWFDPRGDALYASVNYAAREAAIYGHGSFGAITRHRIDAMLGFFHRDEWSYRLNTLTMGCLGLTIERTGRLRQLVAARRELTVAALLGLGLGLPMAAVPRLYIPAGDVLACGYMAGFLALCARGRLGSVVRLLAPLGRCAVSAYLLQTVVFTLTFYSYGLGLYGRLSPWQGVALSATVWSVELALAHAWLSRFELGPVEWLWRSWSYRRRLPFVRT